MQSVLGRRPSLQTACADVSCHDRVCRATSTTSLLPIYLIACALCMSPCKQSLALLAIVAPYLPALTACTGAHGTHLRLPGPRPLGDGPSGSLCLALAQVQRLAPHMPSLSLASPAHALALACSPRPASGRMQYNAAKLAHLRTLVLLATRCIVVHQ